MADLSVRKPVRVLSTDEIEKTLTAHRLYRETEHHEGHRADFSSVDLTGREFSGLDLPGIKMNHAVLRGADFSGADLRGAKSDRRCRPRRRASTVPICPGRASVAPIWFRPAWKTLTSPGQRWSSP
jgi:hypothetical protein